MRMLYFGWNSSIIDVQLWWKNIYDKGPCEILHNSNKEEYLEDEVEDNKENSVQIEEEIGNEN